MLGIALGLPISLAGSAQAAGESMYITPPTGAKVGVSYSFTVSGYAPQTETLYAFDDVESCGPSPYVEHAVHNANGDDYTVSGNFQEVSSGWNSPKATTYYVCAYLVDSSEPFNPDTGVLAEKFQSFAITDATAGARTRPCGSIPAAPNHVSATPNVNCVTARRVAAGSAGGAKCFPNGPTNHTSCTILGFDCVLNGTAHAGHWRCVRGRKLVTIDQSA